MPIIINPSVSPVAAQGAPAPAPVVLQPGSVISARVLQVAGNAVQIAVNGQPIDVQSQVPLQAGQTLQLAVSQNADGSTRLAVVDQQPAAAPTQATGQTASPTPSPTTSPGNTTVIADTVTLAPAALASIAPQATPAAAAPTVQLTPQEALAVAVAAQNAATVQTSLAPLFANLDVAAGLDNLPPQLQQAIAQVLSQQVSLDQNLTGNDIKQAFQSSGLFLEAALATGSVSASTAAPDLKAALIVLRQVLTTSLAATPTQSPTVTAPVGPQGVPQPAAVATPVPIVQPGALPAATLAAIVVEQSIQPSVQVPLPTSLQASPQPVTITAAPETPATASPALAPLLAAEVAAAQISLEGAATPIAPDSLNFSAVSQIVSAPSTPADAAALAAASGAAINLLQEALQAVPLTAGIPPGLLLNNSAMLSLLPAVAGARPFFVDEAEATHSNAPPPPFSGGVPTAQPVVAATLVSNSPAATAMHHLLADTDAAIARQVLLQVASLPDRAAAPGARIDPAAPHWNFEIPFATPQGTAMAQFELSRDGGGNEVAANKQVWRARFSLDVEPAGPVHALITYSGERTSVRMWAERPATAAQMRAGAAELGQALSKAELNPGDIVIRDGMPPQPTTPAKAGHFLDRAL